MLYGYMRLPIEGLLDVIGKDAIVTHPIPFGPCNIVTPELELIFCKILLRPTNSGFLGKGTKKGILVELFGRTDKKCTRRK